MNNKQKKKIRIITGFLAFLTIMGAVATAAIQISETKKIQRFNEEIQKQLALENDLETNILTNEDNKEDKVDAIPDLSKMKLITKSKILDKVKHVITIENKEDELKLITNDETLFLNSDYEPIQLSEINTDEIFIEEAYLDDNNKVNLLLVNNLSNYENDFKGKNIVIEEAINLEDYNVDKTSILNRSGDKIDVQDFSNKLLMIIYDDNKYEPYRIIEL